MLGYSRNTGFGNNKKLTKKFDNLGSVIKAIRNFGIVINKKVLDKKTAIPEDPRLEGDIYSILDTIGTRSMAQTQYPQYNQNDQIQRQARRWHLITMSKHPELEDVLETLTDETIVYDEHDTYCCNAKLNTLMLDEDLISSEDAKKLEELITDKFPNLYRMLGLYKSGAKALFQEFLVEGKKAWEIVYDNVDNPKKIIGLLPIDPLSLLEHWDKDGNRWWIQEPNLTKQSNTARMHSNNTAGQRILHDSQVIYWDWDATGFKFSYIERLLRAFNIYRAIERMKVNWWVMNSQYRTQIIIPSHGLSRQKAAEGLAYAMNSYRDHVEFDDSDGTVRVNGSVSIPANKEYWLAGTTQGEPKIEQIGGEGYDLSSADTSVFKRNYLELTKIPLDRFDPSSAESWNVDPTSARRAELKFAKFVKSLRTSMSEIMLKPLIIQLCLDYPQLTNQHELLDAIVIDFHSENIFARKISQEIMSETAESIQKLMEGLKMEDAQGNIKPYFSLNFLVKKFDLLTAEEIEQNAKERDKEMEEFQEFSKDANEISAELDGAKSEYAEKYRAEYTPAPIGTNSGGSSSSSSGTKKIAKASETDTTGVKIPYDRNRKKYRQTMNEGDEGIRKATYSTLKESVLYKQMKEQALEKLKKYDIN